MLNLSYGSCHLGFPIDIKKIVRYYLMIKYEHLNVKVYDVRRTTSNGKSSHDLWPTVFALIFFHLLARKPNLEKFTIYSNKLFHNFHLS
jgi:hypothetical protein